MLRQPRIVCPNRRKAAVRLALFFGLASTLFAAWTFSEEFGKGPILANPAEKYFDEAPKTVKTAAKFSDREIPAIRQTSGAPSSVWDNPAPATAALPDWGTGPALVAPAIDSPPPAPNTTPPAFTPPNAAASWGPEMPPADSMSTANPYADFLQNQYPYQYQYFTNPYAGFGHFDPNYANLYGNNAFGNYGGLHHPMAMMPQQMPSYPFPQGLNVPFSGRETPDIAFASDTNPQKNNETDDEKKPGSEWTMQRLMPLKVSSPLGETLLTGLKTISPFNTPSGPDKGCGQPLKMRSWQDHPFYFGGFVGYICGSQLVDSMIDQKNGANGGLKVGYNFNDYWGVESRLHFASIDIRETDYGRQVYDAWYAASYPGAPYLPLTTRSNQLTMLDISVQYYPLGNAKWRPFFTYGLGFTRESFLDTFGVNNRVDAVTMPIGIGLRYWWNEHLAIQADLVDNVVFSTGQAKTQNNVAFTVGIAYAFGTSKKCRPTAYWPYTPSSGSRW